MGFFSSSLPTSSGSISGTYNPPSYSNPVSSSSSSAAYNPQPPERIDFAGAAITGIGAASKAPGYVYERPFALVNALTGANPATGQKGLVDQGLDFLKSVPVLGDAVKGVGTLMDYSASLFPSLMNARTYQSIQQTAGLADSTVIPKGYVNGAIDPFQILDTLTGHTTWTVGQMRQDAAQRGFTSQDMANITSGQTGMFDYANKAMNNNRLIDAAGRIVMDPTNLLLGSGAAAKIPKIGEMLLGGSRVAAAVDLTKAAPAAMDVAAALRTGDASAGTLAGFSTMLTTLGRGASEFASGYRKVAVGVTAGQLGVNALDYALPDNTPISAPLEGLFDLGRRMKDDTPFSNNSLFDLYSALHFPIRDVISGATTKAKLAFIDKASSDLTPRTVDYFAPAKDHPGLSAAQRRTVAVNMLGGEDSFLNFMAQHIGSQATESIAPRIMEGNGPGSYQSAVEHTFNVQKAVVEMAARNLADGTTNGRSLVQSIKDWTSGARNSPELAAVRWQPTPELTAATWRAWEPVASRLATLVGGPSGQTSQVVAGILDGMLPKEHLTVAKALFENVATVGADGHRMVAAADARRILSAYPSLYAKKYDSGAFFSRLLTRDAQPVPLGAISQRLNKLTKDAGTIRELLYPMEQWEARAQKIDTMKGTVMNEHGMPDPTRAPQLGEATVLAPSKLNTARTNTGFAPTTLDHVQELRNQTAPVEDAIPTALDRAGYNLDAATQGVLSRDGKLAPSVVLHPNMARTDPTSMLQIAVQTVKATGADHAVVSYSGAEALTKWGLTANGKVYRWNVGAMSPEAAQALASRISTIDGALLHDTSGVLQLSVKASNTAAVEQLSQLAVDMGVMFPEHAPSGIFMPSTADAWVQVVGNDTMKGGRNARSVAALNPDYSVSGLHDQFRTDPRYVAAGEGLLPKDLANAGRSGRAGQSYQGTPVSPDLAAQPAVERGTVTPPLTRIIDSVGAGGNRGQTLFLTNEDTALAHLIPRFDPEVEAKLPPEELAKLGPMQVELTTFNPTYKLKALPGHGTPYYPGQGNAVLDTVVAKQANADLWSYKIGSKVADFQHLMLGKVYSQRMGQEARDVLKNDIMNRVQGKGAATAAEVDGYFRALSDEASTSRIFGRQRMWRSGDSLPPDSINMIARGEGVKHTGKIIRGGPAPTFQGFSPEVIAAVGEHNFYKLIDQSASRFYRAVDKSAAGQGRLGKLINMYHFQQDHGAGLAGHYLKMWYHLFRFVADPRWHAMNALEADVLGYAKYGPAATRFTGAKTAVEDAATFMHQGGAIGAERVQLQDALASGQLDSRQLSGYIGRSFNVERVRTTRDVLKLKAQEDPATQKLLQQFGGTPDEWVKGLEDMVYNFDHKGVPQTVTEEAQRQLSDAQLHEMSPLIQQVWTQNEKIMGDVVNTFHGNVNRSNLERVMNSYFLYWPISYQLKASRWLFDILTKQALGHKSNLGGAWFMNRLIDQHKERLKNDPGYVSMFVDNPQAWQTAAMLLPVTPFDVGIGLSKFTDYTASGLGAHLGLWDKDTSKPFVLDDPLTFASKIMQLGPAYTSNLLLRAAQQTKDKPKHVAASTLWPR